LVKLKIESVKDIEDEEEDIQEIFADIYESSSRQWIKQYLGISTGTNTWLPPSPVFIDDPIDRSEPFFKKTDFRTYFGLSNNSPVPYYFKVIASWITNLDMVNFNSLFFTNS
jgi:hypothetical protein